ncbi:hypothetical protein SAE01_01070 [Segetibacter aerophilus]|uniref:Methyltransferase FkbM domain-containing protein n=2 Tax=Segetibacter aerophilus TaxID=670293 RepID=A0A512B6M1_9BACT|nr:hypothetical protein SAE01_01070 [Segetibacter aerophilus]
MKIIDAGGNIGGTSIFFHNIFPGAKFIIVEPDNGNFDVLQKNIKQNNFGSYKLIKGGLWSKCCYLKIDRDFRDKNDWSVQVVESEKPTDLLGYDIAGLMKLGNFDTIDILKIDIEGAEKKVFDDFNSVSAFLSKTRFIAIEIHDEYNCREQINDCLLQNNFIFFTAGELTIGANKSLVFNVQSFLPANASNEFV